MINDGTKRPVLCECGNPRCTYSCSGGPQILHIVIQGFGFLVYWTLVPPKIAGLRYNNSLCICVIFEKILMFLKSTVWNKSQQYVFSRSDSDSNGVIFPDVSTHSDLSNSICIAKVRLNYYLFT